MTTPTKGRGTLIVFEGLDRAGKTTQCNKLVENLKTKGRNVKAIRFPNRDTPIGQMINTYLKGQSDQEDHVIHLLFSANRWEAAAEIKDAISSGIDVVVDRYYYSGCVYSAAKHNPALSLQWARKPDEGLPRPDICVYLTISPDEAANRGGFGEERYEKQEMQERVRTLFGELQMSSEREDFVEVDGGRPLDEVEADVLKAVETRIAAVGESKKALRVVEPW